METKETITAQELYNKASRYVDTGFNFIQLSVLEKVTDNTLFEYIRSEEISNYAAEVYEELPFNQKVDTIAQFVHDNHFDFEFNCDKVAAAFAEYIVETSSKCDLDDVESNIWDNLPSGRVSGSDFAEHMQDYFESDIEEKADEARGENYPMWNTCFEFRYEPSEETIQAAINAGFGVIEGLEDFNTLLFVSGCGYSFYGAHWIPFFINLPYNDELKEAAEGVDYSMM